MTPVERLLAALDSPRSNGNDRWRCACPVCGGKNRSTLSIGVGDSGAVLVKCWKEGCSPEQIAAAVGLELEDLFPGRENLGSSPPRRRRLMSASQAIDLVSFDCALVWTAAFNLANGHALTAEDLQRLSIAGARTQAIVKEVRA